MRFKSLNRQCFFLILHGHVFILLYTACRAGGLTWPLILCEGMLYIIKRKTTFRKARQIQIGLNHGCFVVSNYNGKWRKFLWLFGLSPSALLWLFVSLGLFGISPSALLWLFVSPGLFGISPSALLWLFVSLGLFALPFFFFRRIFLLGWISDVSLEQKLRIARLSQGYIIILKKHAISVIWLHMRTACMHVFCV